MWNAEWVGKKIMKSIRILLSLYTKYRFSKMNEKISVTQIISSLWFFWHLSYPWFWPWISDPTVAWGETPFCFVNRYDTIYWVACGLFLRAMLLYIYQTTRRYISQRQESCWIILSFRVLMSLKILWRIPSHLLCISSCLNVLRNLPHAKNTLNPTELSHNMVQLQEFAIVALYFRYKGKNELLITDDRI
jgi:hypothetical protein